MINPRLEFLEEVNLGFERDKNLLRDIMTHNRGVYEAPPSDAEVEARLKLLYLRMLTLKETH